MADPAARDIFDKAREWVSAALFLAGALAIVGSLLDWVTFTVAEPAVPGVRPSDPISGLDIGDGKVVAGAGVVMILGAFMLVLRQKAAYAGLAMIASVVAGAISVSDYRSIGEVTAQVNLVGVPHVATGLTLVVVASFLGLVASIAGVLATPRRD